MAKLKIALLFTLLSCSLPSRADIDIKIFLEERCLQLEDQIRITHWDQSEKHLQERKQLKDITLKVLEGPDRFELLSKQYEGITNPDGSLEDKNIDKFYELQKKYDQIKQELEQQRKQYFQTLTKSNVQAIDGLLNRWVTLCRNR